MIFNDSHKLVIMTYSTQITHYSNAYMLESYSINNMVTARENRIKNVPTNSTDNYNSRTF